MKERQRVNDAKLYLAPAGMMGIPFARFYDAVQVKERILDTLEARGLKYKILS